MKRQVSCNIYNLTPERFHFLKHFRTPYPLKPSSLLKITKPIYPTIPLYSHLHKLLLFLKHDLLFSRKWRGSPLIFDFREEEKIVIATSSSRGETTRRGAIRATGRDRWKKDGGGGASLAFPCFEKSRWQREFPIFTTRLPVPVLPPLPDFLSSLRRPFTCFRGNVYSLNVRNCSFEWTEDIRKEKVCGGLARLGFFERLDFGWKGESNYIWTFFI